MARRRVAASDGSEGERLRKLSAPAEILTVRPDENLIVRRGDERGVVATA
jgi:hypothetical protein